MHFRHAHSFWRHLKNKQRRYDKRLTSCSEAWATWPTKMIFSFLYAGGTRRAQPPAIGVAFDDWLQRSTDREGDMTRCQRIVDKIDGSCL